MALMVNAAVVRRFHRLRNASAIRAMGDGPRLG
jgi:hypothetical protein